MVRMVPAVFFVVSITKLVRKLLKISKFCTFQKEKIHILKEIAVRLEGILSRLHFTQYMM